MATSVDIAGDLAAEFSYGSFDELLEAAFYGEWTANVLTVGDVRNTFSIAKGYTDVGVYSLFKGAHVSTFALDIPADGKITATFNMACLDYADSEEPLAVAPVDPTTTPFLSQNNVGTILVDGASLEGAACVSAMTINLDNSLQAQRCIGSDKLGPGAQIATEAAITGAITLAWSARAWEIWKNTFTRVPVAIQFPITDSLGNKYIFDFPAVEVDGELPSGGKRDLIEVTLNYTVAKISPTITRIPFAAVTSVSVAPSTASIAVAATDNIEYRVALERHNRRVQRNDSRFGEGQVGVVEGELTDLQNHAMLLAHFIVKDWKGVQDDEGRELEYSTGAAAELLETNAEFLLFVLRGGTKVAAEAEQELAETVGKLSSGTSGKKTGQAAKSESSSINA